MTTLNSSAIRAVEYDPATRRLLIWFPNDGPFTFYRVPASVYRGLVTASSPGTYYNLYIRGRYR